MHILNVADIKYPNDPQGRSYRQVNAERVHKIPLGTLVELKTGERLIVMMHTRDCDQTPLYALGVSGDEGEDGLGRRRWHLGYCEERLTVVEHNAPVHRKGN